jgi:PST family polysaccharide transporter
MALSKLRRALRHPISQNALALVAIQAATFFVPLLTLPYVSRVLSKSDFGLVLFCQSLSLMLTLLIDWGFTYDGVRLVAAARHDPGQMAAVVARIRGAQLLLAGASTLVVLGCWAFIGKLHAQPSYLLFAWIAAVATGLMTNWYFLGMEKVRLVATLQLGVRLIAAALTFLLVTKANQGWIVLALFAGSSVVMWLMLDVLMYRQVQPRLPRLRESVTAVRGAGLLFVGTVAAALYTTFNVVLLGFFVSSAAVATFAIAERILRTSLQVATPIAGAAYPRLAYLQASDRGHRARQLIVVTIVVVGGMGLLLAVGLAVFASPIIRVVFGQQYVHESAPILRILVLIVPLGIIGATAGSWLMTRHLDRQVATIILSAGVINVILGCILTPIFGPQAMAWSVVCAELTAAVGGVVAVYLTDRDSEVRLLPRWSRLRGRRGALTEGGGPADA